MSSITLLDRYGRPLFKKSHLSTVEDAGGYVGGPDTFGDYEARRFRCALFKALYQNTAYDGEMHSWANSRNRGSGLYKYTRGTNTPAYRLAEVFATHIFNGRLDMKAGDGKTLPSAIPIETENEAIRRPIARFWRDTNMQVQKATLCRTGTVCGDAVFALNDNVRKRRIEGEPLDPSSFRHIGRDHQGNVTDYIRQEYRPNPEYRPARRFAEEKAFDPGSRPDEMPFSLYTEVCWRDGEDVVYQTYRGEGSQRKPYNWRGLDEDGKALPPQWDVPYGFIPLVVIPHIQSWPGQQWGFSEYHALLVKTDEVNDLGSKLHDQIRKCVEGAWFFAGMRPPDDRKTVIGSGEPTAPDPQPGRQEIKAIYAPTVGATASELVIPLDIQFASLEILNQKEELERDSPVLRFEHLRVSGDASAKALREARKPAEGVIQERRSGYDDLMVRAHKMAISMGSMKGYPEYVGADGKPFPPESYENGDLDHAISYRSVYGVDPLDQAELDLAQANAVNMWKTAGVPVRFALERAGWTEDQLEAFDEAAEEEAKQALETQKAMIALAPPAAKPAAKPAVGRPSLSPTPN